MKRKPIAIPSESLIETPVHPALKPYTGYCMHKIALRFKSIQQKKLDKYNLCAPQVGILRLIQVEGPLSQIFIGQTLGIDKATMVKLIDDLEANNWVARHSDKADRRIKHIDLTKKGTNFLNKVAEMCREAEDDFFTNLTAKEKEQFKALLHKIL